MWLEPTNRNPSVFQMLSPGYSFDMAYVEFLNLEDAVHFMESNQVAHPHTSTSAVHEQEDAGVGGWGVVWSGGIGKVGGCVGGLLWGWKFRRGGRIWGKITVNMLIPHWDQICVTHFVTILRKARKAILSFTCFSHAVQSFCLGGVLTRFMSRRFRINLPVTNVLLPCISKAGLLF